MGIFLTAAASKLVHLPIIDYLDEISMNEKGRFDVPIRIEEATTKGPSHQKYPWFLRASRLIPKSVCGSVRALLMCFS